MLIQLPFTVLHCEGVLCTTHDIVIESLYDSIIYALLNAANSSIPFTRPHLKYYQKKDSRLERLCKTFFC